MNLNSYQKVETKHTVFLGLLILAGLFVRVLWSFWGASEYWGDGYHNIWIINQTQEFGNYFDYKDRHLVWLPAYRFLLWIEYTVLAPDRLNNLITPFLLQIWYLTISFRFAFRKLKLEKNALTIAFILLWPLPIIYGGLNMPEGLALASITTIFYFAHSSGSSRNLLMIGLFSALAALTRHEATAFLGIYTLVLFILGNRWKSVSIVIGVVFGLLILSGWNWLLSENPFFWLTSKFNASSSGASDFIERVGLVPRISEALFAVILVFPWLIAAPFYMRSFRKSISELRDESLTPVFTSTIIFLAVFLVGSLFFFHGADPKYLLIASFPCSLWTIYFLRTQKRIIQQTAIGILICLIPLYALLFHIRSFNLELERRLGEQLEAIIPTDFDGKLWCDFPTVLVYADWNPGQVISSDQINRELETSATQLIEILHTEEIEYIISADYDHSSVFSLFEEMEEGVAFTIGDIQFTPVALVDPASELAKNNLTTPFPGLAEISVRGNKELTVWRVEEK